jgi:hypothetical protein
MKLIYESQDLGGIIIRSCNDCGPVPKICLTCGIRTCLHLVKHPHEQISNEQSKGVSDDRTS